MLGGFFGLLMLRINLEVDTEDGNVISLVILVLLFRINILALLFVFL